MDIIASHIAKKYKRDWVFREVSYEFLWGNSYAIVGFNGSGKSTLMQVLAGVLPPTEGEVVYKQNNTTIPQDLLQKHLSIAAPYMELIEEFSLSESYDFHFKFKSSSLSKSEFFERCYLKDQQDKRIGAFSSGMKQRYKLGLAMFSEAPILFLDEPTSNLDSRGREWYQEEIASVKDEKLLFICSNELQEYHFCEDQIDITTFKK